MRLIYDHRTGRAIFADVTTPWWSRFRSTFSSRAAAHADEKDDVDGDGHEHIDEHSLGLVNRYTSLQRGRRSNRRTKSCPSGQQSTDRTMIKINGRMVCSMGADQLVAFPTRFRD